eukprot:2734528-Amphidinium_carterae.1
MLSEIILCSGSFNLDGSCRDLPCASSIVTVLADGAFRVRIVNKFGSISSLFSIFRLMQETYHTVINKITADILHHGGMAGRQFAT